MFPRIFAFAADLLHPILYSPNHKGSQTYYSSLCLPIYCSGEVTIIRPLGRHTTSKYLFYITYIGILLEVV